MSVLDDSPLYRQPTEAEKVESWRLEEALRLGVPYRPAQQFAAGKGDLRQLEQLIRLGCAPPLAADILS